MKPARSKEHLVFIRSLPCCVSGRSWGVEAAHVGRRGMGQKCSDFETIPLNSLFHREQHQMGLRAFCRAYDLNIASLLELINRKPRIMVWDCRYIALWGEEDPLSLGYVEQGLDFSIRLLKDRVRDLLSDRIRARVHEFRGR